MNVSPESASQFGELVADPVTNELLHYTEKPETFVSDRINCCVYVFTPDIFTAIRLRDVSSQRKDTAILRRVSSFEALQQATRNQVRTILDIGCGYGSFGAHLLSKHLLTMCIANYEASGSQVQLTLERGLPAMIASFVSKQLPYPSLSFDMLHCSSCGIDWDQKEGLFLVEIDRVLKPGGYFVWTSPLTNARSKEDLKRWSFVRDFAETRQDCCLKKTTKTKCYSSRKPGVGPSVCNKGHDVESPYYKPLQMCLGGTRCKRWIPIEGRTRWPSRWLVQEEVGEDAENWKVTVREYWSLLSPLIFSDHPKRPGDEDPSPPYNMLRNVLDMNAQFGGLNSACEAFPSYPRTYDLVHADNLLSLQTSQHRSSCSLLNIFTEIDRLLRPEGWVIIRDTAQLVETARALTTQLKWEARVIEVESSSEQRLLICQKPFTKRQSI
ncbi:hypothetical protein HID58_003237 [Brassica napus]|uniref:Methyltransferase n=1 Tax=Brassica napus TaxID=3708 RepID=A0ABQ8ESL4_BRANA|nr:hypothetical protein HID58_003237 [Brassica napus]